MTHTEIISSLKKGDFKPIYFLSGEESFYIDEISNYIANNCLKEEDRGFNQSILYGTKDLKVEEIIAEAKQFPFGSERRVVLVREAQNVLKIEELEKYVVNPQPTTILVICYKGKSLDKRKKFAKALIKNHIVFESKSIYENKIPDWINNYISSKGFSITNKACMILSESLGANLSKIVNEIKKLMLLIKEGEEITSELIEQHIGVSKDFNIFEFQNSLGERNSYKSNKIAKYFVANSKEYPLPKILGSLFNYFQKLITFHSLKRKGDAASILGVHPFFIKDYEKAARSYTTNQLINIFSLLKEYDLRSKGINNKNVSSGELLKELVIKILRS